MCPEQFVFGGLTSAGCYRSRGTPVSDASAGRSQKKTSGDRRLAAEARRDRDRLQEQIVQIAASVPGLIYSFQLSADGSTRMPFASDALKSIFDLEPADVSETAEPLLALIHPDDIGSVMAAIQESAHAMLPASREFRVCRRRLGTIWVEATAVPKLEPGGSVLWYGFMQDVTARRQSVQALRESERRFSTLLDNVELASVMRDRRGRITYCNDYLLRLTGWRLKDVVGASWVARFLPTDLAVQETTTLAALLLDDPASRHHESEILTRAGERRRIHWNNTVLLSGAGDATGTASIGEDISERTRAAASIKRLTRVYALLSGISALVVRARSTDELFSAVCKLAIDVGAFRMAWIGVVDPHNHSVRVVVSCGDGAREYLESIAISTDADNPLGNGPTGIAVRENRAVWCDNFGSDPRTEPWHESGVRFGWGASAAIPLRMRGGTLSVLNLYASGAEAFDDEEQRLLLEMANDIALAHSHIEQSERIAYLALHDPLTGLANRTLFVDRVTQYVRSAASGGHKLALLLIDLERFKNVNDNLGWAAGDSLLRQVAEWLTRHAEDAVVTARVGANHFAIVLPTTQGESDVARHLENMLAAFREYPFRLANADYRISFNAGAVLYPTDGASADTLFQNAEAALARAKERGDRYLFYTQAMTDAVAGALSLENRLRQALKFREFVLHYQPLVNLETGKVIGAEALIRWNDPRIGLLPPHRFIAVLEETGLIHNVGEWALQTAIGDYLRWRAAGFAIGRVSVNVSPLQLRRHDFAAEIARAVSIDPSAAEGLELEITESVIMADVAHSIASLRSIRDLGIKIAVDDFGTGFSSLSYLTRLPIDTLKIDHSFIRDMTSGPEGLAMVSTVVSLAHSLKLTAVAEGVETVQQARMLRDLGCDQMQGYLFSPPVPVDVFAARFLVPRQGSDDREAAGADWCDDVSTPNG